jgi:hypothetical protein
LTLGTTGDECRGTNSFLSAAGTTHSISGFNSAGDGHPLAIRPDPIDSDSLICIDLTSVRRIKDGTKHQRLAAMTLLYSLMLLGRT